MIIVNLWLPDGCNFLDGEYNLDFVAAVNDTLSLSDDPPKISECIQNEIEPTPETLYEIWLERVDVLGAFPARERAFQVNKFHERQTENGHIILPIKST